MKDIRRLPDAELTIMQKIWDMTPPVTAREVQKSVEKGWKATSVLTFLLRLTEKGFLRCEKEGRQNRYTPLVTREAYLQCESVGFIERLCGGSVKNLVACLSDAGALSDSDIDELRAFLDAQGR